jgi:hypothetical protein
MMVSTIGTVYSPIRFDQENKTMTVRELRDRLTELINNGFGDHQITYDDDCQTRCVSKVEVSEVFPSEIELS